MIRRHTLLLLVAAAVAQLTPTIVWGKNSPASPAERRQVVQAIANKSGIANYMRKLPNGVERIYLNVSGADKLAAMKAVHHDGSNVFEIMMPGPPHSNTHTWTLFDEAPLHATMMSTSGKWRINPWTEQLRYSSSPLYSALIHLSTKEADNLRALLDKAWAEQGPEAAAGVNWEHGHLKNAFGIPGFNCASLWSSAPIGEHGEQLWQLLGLRGADANPNSLMNSLEQAANEKVFGIAVYGPEVANFATQPNVNRVQF